jgi:hypothetical protein
MLRVSWGKRSMPIAYTKNVWTVRPAKWSGAK